MAGKKTRLSSWRASSHPRSAPPRSLLPTPHPPAGELAGTKPATQAGAAEAAAAAAAAAHFGAHHGRLGPTVFPLPFCSSALSSPTFLLAAARARFRAPLCPRLALIPPFPTESPLDPRSGARAKGRPTPACRSALPPSRSFSFLCGRARHLPGLSIATDQRLDSLSPTSPLALRLRSLFFPSSPGLFSSCCRLPTITIANCPTSAVPAISIPSPTARRPTEDTA